MQRFHVRSPMGKQGLVATYIVTEIQDIINILKDHDSSSTVHSPNIMFHGSEEFLHLLQGSLLINGLDKEIWTSNMMMAKRGIHSPGICTYIDQLDY